MLPDGKIWYVDSHNHRIVKIDPSNNYAILRTVGRLGNGEGEFDAGVYSMTRDNNGFLYIMSTFGNIKKLDSNGGYIASYNLSTLDSPNDLSDPRGIVYDIYTDTFLISNKNRHRVERFTKDFVFIDGFGSFGTGDSQFNEPQSLSVDVNGRIYVADEFNARVQVFSSDFTHQFNIVNWTEGSNTINFEAVKDIVILSDGTITITSQNNQRVVQFDESGNFIRVWGFSGVEDSNLISPQYLAKDQNDNIFVSDGGKRAILKYSSTGVYKYLRYLDTYQYNWYRWYGQW